MSSLCVAASSASKAASCSVRTRSASTCAQLIAGVGSAFEVWADGVSTARSVSSHFPTAAATMRTMTHQMTRDSSLVHAVIVAVAIAFSPPKSPVLGFTRDFQHFLVKPPYASTQHTENCKRNRRVLEDNLPKVFWAQHQQEPRLCPHSISRARAVLKNGHVTQEIAGFQGH